MKYTRIIQLIFIFICILLVFVPFVFTDFKGGTISKTEKRVLAEGPLMLLDNKSKQFYITKWINDNIGFRSIMVELKALIDYKVFEKSSSKQVAIGKNDFLFYIPGNNLEIAKGTYPLSNNELNNINYKLNKCNNILKSHNIKLLVTIAPSKASIYPEYVKGGNYSRTISPSDKVKELLKDNITFIDLKNVLYDYKEKHNELLYWRYDTHWNNLGAFIAYRTIIDEINKLENNKLDINKDYIFKNTIRNGDGDLAKFLGINNLVKLNEEYIIISPKEIKFNEISVKNNFKTEKGQKIYYYKNDNVTNKISILGVGDSMFGEKILRVSELFASSVYKYIYSYGGNLSKELITLSKPDYIIIERTERDTRLLKNINCENLF